jgi:hypothetical protein
VYACLAAVGELMELGLVDEVSTVDMCTKFAPITLHPSSWISSGAVKVCALRTVVLVLRPQHGNRVSFDACYDDGRECGVVIHVYQCAFALA